MASSTGSGNESDSLACSSPSSSSTSSYVDDEVDPQSHASGTAGFVENVLGFWKEMGKDLSPLRVAHPSEHRLYSLLGSLPSSCDELLIFCNHLEKGLAACLSSGGRRKPETRSILLGQSLRRLRSNVSVRETLTDAANVASVLHYSKNNGDISAVLASTVDHLWNDRGRRAVSTLSSPGATFPPLSAQEEEKVAYHAGWTVKRVRDSLVATRKSFGAQSSSGATVYCSASELLDLLGTLGQDRLGDDGRYLFHVMKDVADFFKYLHGVVQGLLADKVLDFCN